MRTRRSYAFPPYRGTRGWILQNVVDRLFDQRCGGDKLSIAVAPHASGRAASRLRGSTMWGWLRSCPRNQGRPMLRLCDTDGSPTFIEPPLGSNSIIWENESLHERLLLSSAKFPINGSVGFVHFLLGFKAKNAAHASFRSSQRGRPLSRREEEEVVQPLRERYRAHTFSRPSLPHLDMSVRSWAVELFGSSCKRLERSSLYRTQGVSPLWGSPERGSPE